MCRTDLIPKTLRAKGETARLVLEKSTLVVGESILAWKNNFSN